jgi:integrase
MPVTQRGGSWQATINKNKNRWRYSFASEAAAKGWEADAMAALANGRPVPQPDAVTHGAKPGAITFAKACDNFLAEAYAGSTSDWPKTVELYLKAYKAFWPDWMAEDVATQVEADRYAKSLYDRKQAQSTVNAKLSVLSKLCQFMLQKRYTHDAPRFTRRKPSNERGSFISVEDETTLLRLLRQFGLHEAADAVTVLLDTGLRPKELWKETGRDYEVVTKRISVRMSKNGESRTVVATNRTAEIMRRRKEVSGPTGKLFPMMTNARLLAAWDKARLVMGRMDDPDFIPYICRHTCASRLVQRGVAIQVVMLWMGHKSIQMTMRYAKHAPAEFADAAAALETDPKANLRVVEGGAS